MAGLDARPRAHGGAQHVVQQLSHPARHRSRQDVHGRDPSRLSFTWMRRTRSCSLRKTPYRLLVVFGEICGQLRPQSLQWTNLPLFSYFPSFLLTNCEACYVRSVALQHVLRQHHRRCRCVTRGVVPGAGPGPGKACLTVPATHFLVLVLVVLQLILFEPQGADVASINQTHYHECPIV